MNRLLTEALKDVEPSKEKISPATFPQINEIIATLAFLGARIPVEQKQLERDLNYTRNQK